MGSLVLWVAFLSCVLHIVSGVPDLTGEDKNLEKVPNESTSEKKDELTNQLDTEGSPRNTESSPPGQESPDTKSFNPDELYAKGETLRKGVLDLVNYMFTAATQPLKEVLTQQTDDFHDTVKTVKSSVDPAKEVLNRQASDAVGSLYRSANEFKEEMDRQAGDYHDTIQIVKNSATPVKEKLHRKASGAVQSVYKPLKDELVLQAYDAIDAANEVGAATLRKMETTKRGRIAVDVWKKIGLKETSLEDKFKAMIDVVSAELVNHVPIYTSIQPLEVDKSSFPSKYICGAKGLISDLTSIKKVNSDVKQIDDGFMFEIDYKFTDLYFNYTEFYISVWSFTAHGHLHLKFNDNNVRITLKIPKFKQIFRNLINTQCVVHVVDVKVTYLGFEKSTLTGEKDDMKTKLLDAGILTYLRMQDEMLREKFEKRLLSVIQQNLDTQDAWVCKEKDFDDMVQSKVGKIEDFKPTDKFEKNCGKDLYTEPNQNSVQEESPQ